MARAKGWKVIISPLAKEDIDSLLLYLSLNWSQGITGKFLQKLETFYTIVSINPHVFSFYSKSRNIRNYAITKQNVIYYRTRRKVVEIITVFDARQSPSRLKKILSKNNPR
jgi:plasmid stabilization system protein ParE